MAGDKELGFHLILAQRGNRLEPEEWHLNQDFVTTMGLRREGDHWLCIEEGYEEVARLKRGVSGEPTRIEVKQVFLADYLCARSANLLCSSYRSRTSHSDKAPILSWKEGRTEETTENLRWMGRLSEINQDGMPYGEEIAIFRMGRTDVDSSKEVPVYENPKDGGIFEESRKVKVGGKKVYQLRGEFWKKEWVNAAKSSPRVRGDRIPSTLSFFTDAKGKEETRETLIGPSRWLWFRPELIMAIAHRRGGELSWYTRETGSIRCSPGYETHFGVNSIGLVNIYSKDIAILPDWQQRIFAGHNTRPDGGVSDELIASQMRATPADTLAPEEYLALALARIIEKSTHKYGFSLLLDHSEVPEILIRTHRFRSTDSAGLLSLAKDVARLTADLLDVKALRKLLPNANKKLGSLKLLEQLVSLEIGEAEARKIMGPLYGIYDLRLGDAHLSRTGFTKTYTLVGINEGLPPVLQGSQLLDAACRVLSSVIIALKFNGS